MRCKEEVQAALASVLVDLAHLEELREMQTLNQGFSEVRQRLLAEVERLMQERRETLQWVLHDGDNPPPTE